MWRSVLCVYFCAASVVLAALDETDSLVVRIESGPVRGYRHRQAAVFEFYDIPYATAPTGVHKFRPPLAPPTWFNTLEAVDRNIMCPQPELEYGDGLMLNMTQDENCLLVSVYVPDTSPQNVSVVVYVHGGAFIIGQNTYLKPIELANNHNIIAVTFNYRLGVHGFLCLGTEDIPGNAGMKDQVALLRWVQKNIASFGGNPNDVTIAGYSAGSVAVDLLMLSKSASGLFNKVIPESGASLSPFAIQPDPMESAKWFAKSLNFDNVDNIDALEQFYKTASYEQLTSDLFHDRTDATFVFSPCIERPAANYEVFLDESPAEILKNQRYRKVPLLFGFNNMEGLFQIYQFDAWKTKMNDRFSDFLPADLIFDSEEEKENVAKRVKEFYFGDKPVDNDTILHFVDFVTDIMFSYPTLRSVKLQVERGHDEIYLYDFNYIDENTLPVPHTDVRGADHSAQTVAVFTGPTSPGYEWLTDEYKKLSINMRQMWANFIKTGKPVHEDSDLPSWPAVSFNWSPHMSLGNEFKLKSSLMLERTLFWEEIYDKYYREPVPPFVSG